jgi:hypothetical protein
MRRTLGFLVLAIIAVVAAGCASNTPNANSPGTTTYGNSAPASDSGGAPKTAATPSNTNSNRPGETGIKPPTSK